ncbi:Glutamine synthetase and cystathionine beta-lyase binding protein [Geodia barretti]|uniref:Glutamine synthetase and cystathionine beta-lyase binding protein n=1 Tax=Geodia barretti TaxID=519541 RepID=A0AA35WGX0_GEOBA|nr:Glutamine synthetase and cystathionine beta-lyase binding protein [Geodia barretti]
MAIYFLLGRLSGEGQRMLHSNPDLVSDTAATLDVEGAKILGQYAVLGHYDFITMVLAEENEAVARLSAEFGAQTGLHFETLSAVAVGFLADNDPSGESPDRAAVQMATGNGADR